MLFSNLFPEVRMYRFQTKTTFFHFYFLRELHHTFLYEADVSLQEGALHGIREVW